MMDDFKIEPLELGTPSKLKLPQFSLALKILLIALGVLIIGGVLFLVFGNTSFAERNVEVTIDGPAEISSGDHVTYIVHYENKNRTDLVNATLSFTYPPDAVPFKDGAITQHSNVIVDLGTIQGKSSGEQSFEGIIVGLQGNVKAAKALLTYTPGSFLTQLQKSSESSVTIVALPVPLSVVVPPTVLSGQEVHYIIDYRNQSGVTLENLRLKVQYPEGFVAKEKKDTWDIGSLPDGEGDRITIAGTLSGRERESKTFSVQLQKLTDTSDGAQYVTIEKAEASSIISTPLISAVLSVQGGTDYTAHVNERLDYTIRLTNNTNTDLTSFTATAKLEGTMYDLTTVESMGSFDSRTRTITWNSSVVPELGLLRANQSVEIPFKVRIKSTFPSRVTASDSAVKATIHAETFNVPEVLSVDRIAADDELVTRISTALSFSQQMLASDSQWGSEGPYPPRVDQTTVLTSRMTLVNPANEVISAKVTAVLLPGVTWRNQYRVKGSQVEPTYDPKTSTVTWNVGTVPSGVGVALSPYELYFQISITPSGNEVNHTIPLIKNMVFEGTDALTKEKITQRLQDVQSLEVQQ